MFEKLKCKRKHQPEEIDFTSLPKESALQLAVKLREEMSLDHDPRLAKAIATMDEICYFALQLPEGDHEITQANGRHFLFRISQNAVHLYRFATCEYDRQLPHLSAVNHVILTIDSHFGVADIVTEVDLEGLKASKRGQGHHGFHRRMTMNHEELPGAYALHRNLNSYLPALQAIVTSSHR